MSGLTARESQIMFLVMCGCSVKIIERQLSISRSTIFVHLNHVYSKLDALNREHAVALYIIGELSGI